MSDTPLGDGWWLASDGKYYPPQSHALPTVIPPPVAPATPPRKKHGVGKWFLISVGAFVGVIIVLAMIGAAVGPPAKNTALDASATREATTTAEAPKTEAPKPTTTEKPATTTTAKPTTTTAEPTTTAKQPTTTAMPTTTAAPAPSLTVSQKNAQRKAQSYLQMTSFSRKGLIEQLMFEGFASDDATFGVDSLNVDWNTQAAKKAKSYLEMSSFSRSSLIEQLEFEGFSPDQAEYGVGTTGL
ncbi:MAG TPA: Ltp family lipoprotein [Acidimicrobiales bacterium]|nr:Ltp family lipoprotein [Acidimicrobiales bacterium]